MKLRKTFGKFKCEESVRFQGKDAYLLKGNVRCDIVNSINNLSSYYKPIFVQANPLNNPKESYQIGDTAVTIKNCEENKTSVEIFHTQVKKRKETLKKLIEILK